MSRINPNDKYLMNAAAFGSGMRILRQDLCLLCQASNVLYFTDGDCGTCRNQFGLSKCSV
ncbi:MAG: hypothetical protein MR936_05420 [Eubacterium sp.]|nr:hypothetical protein [Eubacterium sp.]